MIYPKDKSNNFTLMTQNIVGDRQVVIVGIVQDAHDSCPTSPAPQSTMIHWTRSQVTTFLTTTVPLLSGLQNICRSGARSALSSHLLQYNRSDQNKGFQRPYSELQQFLVMLISHFFLQVWSAVTKYSSDPSCPVSHLNI